MSRDHDPFPRRWWALAVLAVSLLVITVDNTIVNIALPVLGSDLSAGTAELQWIVDGYTLPFAALLLLSGALGDRYGRHHVLAIGLVVFALGSVLAALSATPTALIAGRVVMGIGAAAIMPSTLSILIHLFADPVERAQAIAIWTAVSGLGVAIGPTLGGWLLEHFAWGSIFLINLPIIAIALAGGRALVPPSRAPGRRPIDARGAALAPAGITARTWAIIGAPEPGWTPAATRGGAGRGLALLLGFVRRQQRAAAPLMDLRLFADSRFGGGALAVTIVFFSLFGALFAYTQILQLVLGFSALEAGIRALPVAVTLAVTAPLAAARAQRTGPRLPVAAGLAVLAAGLAVLASATADSGFGHYLAGIVLMAAGMGFAMAPATEAVMSAVPDAQASVGAAVNDTTRELGGVLGVAVLGSVLASAYTSAMGGAVDATLPPAAAAAARESIGGALAVAHQLGGPRGMELAGTAQAAFVDAAGRSFTIAALIALVGAVAVARRLRGRIPSPGSAPERIPA